MHVVRLEFLLETRTMSEVDLQVSTDSEVLKLILQRPKDPQERTIHFAPGGDIDVNINYSNQ